MFQGNPQESLADKQKVLQKSQRRAVYDSCKENYSNDGLVSFNRLKLPRKVLKY